MKALIIGAMLIVSALTAAAQTAYPTHPGTGAGIYFSPGYVAMRHQTLRSGQRHSRRRVRRSASRHHHRAARL